MRKLLTLLIFLFATAANAAYVQWSATALTPSGTTLKGYTVTVRDYPAGTLSTIYSDGIGTVTDNPFLTSSTDGTYSFYTGADGIYKIIVTKPGMSGYYDMKFMEVSGSSFTASELDPITVSQVQSSSTVKYGGLPTCDASTKGFIRTVTDSDYPYDLGNGGGTFTVLVFCDGTNWVVFSDQTSNLKYEKCITIEDPADADDFLFFRAESAITITGIDCLVADGTSVGLLVKECDGNGATCSNIEASITCAATNTTESSGIDNASVDAGDWVRIDPGTNTGSVTQMSVCVNYTAP